MNDTLIPKSVVSLIKATKDKKNSDTSMVFENIKVSKGKALVSDTYILVELNYSIDNPENYPVMSEDKGALQKYEPFLIHRDAVTSLEKSRPKKSPLPILTEYLGAVMSQNPQETVVYNTDLTSENVVNARQEYKYTNINVDDFFSSKDKTAGVLLKVSLLHKLLNTLKSIDKNLVVELKVSENPREPVTLEGKTSKGEKVRGVIMPIKKNQ